MAFFGAVCCGRGAVLEVLRAQRREAQAKVRELLLTAETCLGERLKSAEYEAVREEEPTKYLTAGGAPPLTTVGIATSEMPTVASGGTPRECCAPRLD